MLNFNDSKSTLKRLECKILIEYWFLLSISLSILCIYQSISSYITLSFHWSNFGRSIWCAANSNRILFVYILRQCMMGWWNWMVSGRAFTSCKNNIINLRLNVFRMKCTYVIKNQNIRLYCFHFWCSKVIIRFLWRHWFPFESTVRKKWTNNKRQNDINSAYLFGAHRWRQ